LSEEIARLASSKMRFDSTIHFNAKAQRRQGLNKICFATWRLCAFALKNPAVRQLPLQIQFVPIREIRARFFRQ
jgi:hypothetical protein